MTGWNHATPEEILQDLQEATERARQPSTGWFPVPPEMYLPPTPLTEEEGRAVLEQALARQEWDKKHPRCFDCGRFIKLYWCERCGL